MKQKDISRDVAERRKIAVELYLNGASYSQIGRAVSRSRERVRQWFLLYTKNEDRYVHETRSNESS